MLIDPGRGHLQNKSHRQLPLPSSQHRRHRKSQLNQFKSKPPPMPLRKPQRNWLKKSVSQSKEKLPSKRKLPNKNWKLKDKLLLPERLPQLPRKQPKSSIPRLHHAKVKNNPPSFAENLPS